MFSFFGGGLGGHPEGDGLNHGNAPISTATIPPVEILEAAYPVMFTQWALRPDSGGAGRHRGGLGAIYEIELLEEQAEVFLFGERGTLRAAAACSAAAPARLNRFVEWPTTTASSRPADGVEGGRRPARARRAGAPRNAGRRRLRRPRERDAGGRGARPPARLRHRGRGDRAVQAWTVTGKRA